MCVLNYLLSLLILLFYSLLSDLFVGWTKNSSCRIKQTEIKVKCIIKLCIMFYMSPSLSSSVSAVLSSRSGEGQRAQVLPVSAGWQLHACEYHLADLVTWTRGVIRSSTWTSFLINYAGLNKLTDFMEMTRKKRSTEMIPCFLVAGGAPDHGCVHPGRHRQQLQHGTGAFVAILVFCFIFVKDLLWSLIIRSPNKLVSRGRLVF